MDVSFNNIKDADTAIQVGLEKSVYGPVYSYRNTYEGKVEVLNYVGSGPVTFTQDTINNEYIPKMTYSGDGIPTPRSSIAPDPPKNLLIR
jgi:hypothetical protein